MGKIIFTSFLFIHAIIHLPGFVKAFGFADVKQLTQVISRPFGLMWLGAFLCFVVTAILFAMNNKSWWIFGLISILLSQGLIISFWSDAKYGSIVNGIILIACLIGFSTWQFYRTYQQDAKQGLFQTASLEESILTEQDIEPLPELIKKYIRYTGAIGKPRVNNFKIVFKGKIRKDEASGWMPFSSEQYNFMQKSTRLFFMDAKMKQLPVAGYHRFVDGKADMDIRLFSLFRVQYQDGPAMDKAETVTFFNDMCCMAPATLIDDRISWQEVSDTQVNATFTNNGITISAALIFNTAGELVNFKSNDRYAADAAKQLPWSTPLKNYKGINGHKLAGYAEAIYTYPDRDLTYGVFELSSITYNNKAFK
ncbi:MAG: hypothetical protein KA479_09195 [Saprospiraceae bacterium]|nr:hypothetical protein [Saprospiraceae bacterium]